MSNLKDFLPSGTGQQNFDLISQNLGDVSGTIQLDLSQYDIFNFRPIAPTVITFSGLSANNRNSAYLQVNYGGTADLTWDSRLSFDNSHSELFVDVTPGSIDLTSLTYQEESPSMSSGIFDFTFKDDGTKVYTIDNGNKAIRQYSLSVAYDITTVVYDNVDFDLTSQNNFNSGIFFKPDGTKIIITAFSTPNAGFYEYDLSTPWDISSIAYNNNSFVTGFESVTGSYISSDGSMLYILRGDNQTIIRYDMSTPWDVTTSVDSGVSYQITESYGTMYDIEFFDSGFSLFLLTEDNSSNMVLAKYLLSQPFDITTAVFDSVTPTPVVDNTSYSFKIRENDNSLYIGEYTDGVVSRYSYTEDSVGSTKANIHAVQYGTNEVLATVDLFD